MSNLICLDTYGQYMKHQGIGTSWTYQHSHSMLANKRCKQRSFGRHAGEQRLKPNFRSVPTCPPSPGPPTGLGGSRKQNTELISAASTCEMKNISRKPTTKPTSRTPTKIWSWCVPGRRQDQQQHNTQRQPPFPHNDENAPGIQCAQHGRNITFPGPQTPHKLPAR